MCTRESTVSYLCYLDRVSCYLEFHYRYLTSVWFYFLS